ncbi:MAG: YceI family protein [Betaproteobacteria bacterium]|nr:MAG: YceI family protein [Betaproteobacteria bacterium]
MHPVCTRTALLVVHKTRAILLLFPVLLAAACQTLPPPGETAVLAEPVRTDVNVPSGAPRYSVDPQASEIRLLVYRDGPLARFGHNHVVVGRVHGEIRVGDAAVGSGFRLEIPVDSFVVDAPAARAEEGNEFTPQVSEPARRDTRENMLGREVLDAEKHPLVRVESIALVGPQWGPTVTARVTLRGVMRDLRFAAAVLRQDDLLEVVASFRINQSEFGIEPFTALNGGLRVRDSLDIRVRLVARREK